MKQIRVGPTPVEVLMFVLGAFVGFLAYQLLKHAYKAGRTKAGYRVKAPSA